MAIITGCCGSGGRFILGVVVVVIAVLPVTIDIRNKHRMRKDRAYVGLVVVDDFAVATKADRADDHRETVVDSLAQLLVSGCHQWWWHCFSEGQIPSRQIPFF